MFFLVTTIGVDAWLRDKGCRRQRKLMETKGNLTFFNKKGGSTVYCELEEKVQFYHFSVNERA